MKRDMDLIRDILLKVEADPTLNGSRFETFEDSAFEGHPNQEVAYHIDLLFEAGFVEGFGSMDPMPAISRLTWLGHEFLNDVRDPGIWGKVKEQAKAVPSISLAFAWEIAKAEIKKKLHLP